MKPTTESIRRAWDRIVAATWNCNEDHAREVRLWFTGSATRGAPSCYTPCQCPLARMKVAVPRG